MISNVALKWWLLLWIVVAGFCIWILPDTALHSPENAVVKDLTGVFRRLTKTVASIRNNGTTDTEVSEIRSLTEEYRSLMTAYNRMDGQPSKNVKYKLDVAAVKFRQEVRELNRGIRSPAQVNEVLDEFYKAVLSSEAGNSGSRSKKEEARKVGALLLGAWEEEEQEENSIEMLVFHGGKMRRCGLGRVADAYFKVEEGDVASGKFLISLKSADSRRLRSRSLRGRVEGDRLTLGSASKSSSVAPVIYRRLTDAEFEKRKAIIQESVDKARNGLRR